MGSAFGSSVFSPRVTQKTNFVLVVVVEAVKKGKRGKKDQNKPFLPFEFSAGAVENR